MTDLELLQQALDALSMAVAPKKGKVYALEFQPIDCEALHIKAIEALRARLAQPEPEPVGTQYKYIDAHGKDYWTSEPWEGKKVEAVRYLYATPQPEPVIYARKEGNLIVADLPQVPTGGGGISKDEQPEPILPGGGIGRHPESWVKTYSGGKPNYTQPVEKEWVGLTDETYWEMWVESPSDVLRFAHAIEAKLKEKNSG